MATEFQDKVSDFFARRLATGEGYEHRPAQLEMAAAVAWAIEHEELLLVEAGTGTGKSLAYLVPAILWSARQPNPVIVSTRTLNLQQQLFEHDLPRLSEHLSFPLKVVQARGWSNYVCLRRLLERSGLSHELEQEAAQLEKRLPGSEGTRQELEVSRELWSRCCADSLACSRQACVYFEDCFFFKERRKLEGADLVVTNHSLVMADLALRRQGAPGILPQAECLILDEGHHLEQVATDHLGRQFSNQGLERLVRQLLDKGTALEDTGFLPGLRQRLARADLHDQDKRRLLDLIDHEMLVRIRPLEEAGEEFFELLTFWLANAQERKRHLIPEDFDTEAGRQLRDQGGVVAGQLQGLAGACGQLAELVRELQLPGASDTTSELEGFSVRLKGAARDIEFCLFPDSDDWVYWAFDSRAEIGLVATPLDVGDILKEALFSKLRSLVLTSATLAVDGDLDFFAGRVGCQGDARLQTLQLESPFDYPEQVYLGVATDLPQPGRPGWMDSLIPELIELVDRLRGKTFLLVTSWSLLRELELELQEPLASRGVGLLAQGRASGGALLQAFRGQGDYLLIGTDSFWEGVDVPGEDLSCVILARLPFRVPTDPVVAAQARRLESQGKDPFEHYHLPLAILKLRQGFGRLIRTSSDRGLIYILDHRIRTRRYGRRFFQSLPRTVRRAGPLGGLVDEGLAWLDSKTVDLAPG